MTAYIAILDLKIPAGNPAVFFPQSHYIQIRILAVQLPDGDVILVTKRPGWPSWVGLEPHEFTCGFKNANFLSDNIAGSKGHVFSRSHYILFLLWDPIACRPTYIPYIPISASTRSVCEGFLLHGKRNGWFDLHVLHLSVHFYSLLSHPVSVCLCQMPWLNDFAQIAS